MCMMVTFPLAITYFIGFVGAVEKKLLVITKISHCVIGFIYLNLDAI